MGGIPTNIHAQALTQNAAGEDKSFRVFTQRENVHALSVHGANRLGTNSLLDLVVFGRAAGMHLEKPNYGQV